jgi:hypothetical protein
VTDLTELDAFLGEPLPDNEIILSKPIGGYVAGTVLNNYLAALDDRVADLEASTHRVDSFRSYANIKGTITRLVSSDARFTGTRVCLLRARAFITNATPQSGSVTADATPGFPRRRISSDRNTVATLVTSGTAEVVFADVRLYSSDGPVFLEWSASTSTYITGFVNSNITTTMRLRRTDGSGAILWSSSVTKAGWLQGNTSGTETAWAGTLTDGSPTDGRYVLTIQKSVSADTVIYCAWSHLVADSTYGFTAAATMLAVPQASVAANAYVSVASTDQHSITADAWLNRGGTFRFEAVVMRTAKFSYPKRILAQAYFVREQTGSYLSITMDAVIYATVAVVGYHDDLFKHQVYKNDFDSAVSISDDLIDVVNHRGPLSWALATDTPSGTGQCLKQSGRIYTTALNEGTRWDYWRYWNDVLTNPFLILMPGYGWVLNEYNSAFPVQQAHDAVPVYKYVLEFDLKVALTPVDNVDYAGPYDVEMHLSAFDSVTQGFFDFAVAYAPADGNAHHVRIEFLPEDPRQPDYGTGILLLKDGAGPLIRWNLISDEGVYIYEYPELSGKTNVSFDFAMWLDNVDFYGVPAGYKVTDVRDWNGATEISSTRFTMDAVIYATVSPHNLLLNPDFSRAQGRTWWYPAHAGGIGYCYVCNSDPCVSSEVIDLETTTTYTVDNALSVETFGLVPREGAKTPLPVSVSAGSPHYFRATVRAVDADQSLLVSLGDPMPVYRGIDTRQNLFGSSLGEQMTGWSVEKNALWTTPLASADTYQDGQLDSYPQIKFDGDKVICSLGSGHGSYYSSRWSYYHWHSASRVVRGRFTAGKTYIFSARVGDLVPGTSPTGASLETLCGKSVAIAVCAMGGQEPTFGLPMFFSPNWYDATNQNNPANPSFDYGKHIFVAWTPTRDYMDCLVAIGPVESDNSGNTAQEILGIDRPFPPYSFSISQLSCYEAWGSASLTAESLSVDSFVGAMETWYDVPGASFSAYGRAGFAHSIRGSFRFSARTENDYFHSNWDELAYGILAYRFRLVRAEDGAVVATDEHDFNFAPRAGRAGDSADRRWSTWGAWRYSTNYWYYQAWGDAWLSGTSPGFLDDFTPETYKLQFAYRVLDPQAVYEQYGTNDPSAHFTDAGLRVRSLSIVLDEQDPTGFAPESTMDSTTEICLNPDFAEDLLGWTTDNTGNPWYWRWIGRSSYDVGPATIVRVISDGPSPVTTSMEIEFPTTWDTGVYYWSPVSIQSGMTVSLSFWLREPPSISGNMLQFAISGPSGEDRRGGAWHPTEDWTRHTVTFDATQDYEGLVFGIANWGPNALTVRLSRVSIEVTDHAAPLTEDVEYVPVTAKTGDWTTVSGVWTSARGSRRPILSVTQNGTAAGHFLVGAAYAGASANLFSLDAEFIVGTRLLDSFSANADILRDQTGMVVMDAAFVNGGRWEFGLTADAVFGPSPFLYMLNDAIEDAVEVTEVLTWSRDHYPDYIDNNWMPYYLGNGWWPDDAPPPGVTTVNGFSFDSWWVFSDGFGRSIRVIGTRAPSDPYNPWGTTPAQTYWLKMTLATPKTFNATTFGLPPAYSEDGPYSDWDTTLSLFRDETPDGPERTLTRIAFNDDMGLPSDIPAGIMTEQFPFGWWGGARLYTSMLYGIGVPAGTYYIEVETDTSTASLAGGYLQAPEVGYTSCRVWLEEAFNADSFIAFHFDADGVIFNETTASISADATIPENAVAALTADAEVV